MKPRYSARHAIQAAASFYTNGLSENGYIEDVSIPGCRLLTAAPLQVGQTINLQFRVKQDEPPFHSPLAVVRWVNGYVAGLEFIRMAPEDQSRLRELVHDREQTKAECVA